MSERSLQEALAAWQRRIESFRWEVPETFNFGCDVVDRQAADRDGPALWWRGASEPGGGPPPERRLRFSDVAAASDRVAHLLQASGVGPGDPVLVMLPKVPEWQIAVVGALKTGAVVIPCSTILRAHDLRYRAQHSGAVALVTDRDRAGLVEEVAADLPLLRSIFVLGAGSEGTRARDLETALAEQPDGPPQLPSTRASDPALVYYTSGTTGPPKAVLHTHGYTWTQRLTAEVWLGLAPGERIWTTSDTGWAKAAYSVLFGPWSRGAEVFMYAGRFEPAQELSLLAEVAPQVFCAPPTEYRLLVKDPSLHGRRFPGLRECVSAGEPLNPEVIRAWHDATGLTVRDGYGQTESILLVGNHPGNPVRPGSMGLAMPGHRIEVIDGRGTPVPAGEIGDVAVHGHPPSLFVEYWKDPEATAGARRGEWYVTGDRAYRDDDGFFWFVGRADDVIISAGYRIGPFEVESALIEHPDVVEAAAVASPDPDRGSVVHAFVVLRPGVQGDDALVRSLQEHVKAVTAPYKYPRRITFTDELPKTVSGKIRRMDLRSGR